MPKPAQWPTLAPFRWGRDRGGYVLRGDVLTPATGEMEIYTPDDENPVLQRDFLNACLVVTEIVGVDGDGGPVLGGNSYDGALQFVNRYGLLGLDGAYPPARESVISIIQAQSTMSLYAGFGHDDPSVSSDERNAFFNRLCPPHVSAQMKEEDGRTVIQMAARSLLTWMWLRLAQEKTGDLRPKRCRNCGRWFVVGPGQTERRADAEYCENKCRVAYFRTKQKSGDKGDSK